MGEIKETELLRLLRVLTVATDAALAEVNRQIDGPLDERDYDIADLVYVRNSLVSHDEDNADLLDLLINGDEGEDE